MPNNEQTKENTISTPHTRGKKFAKLEVKTSGKDRKVQLKGSNNNASPGKSPASKSRLVQKGQAKKISDGVDLSVEAEETDADFLPDYEDDELSEPEEGVTEEVVTTPIQAEGEGDSDNEILLGAIVGSGTINVNDPNFIMLLDKLLDKREKKREEERKRLSTDQGNTGRIFNSPKVTTPVRGLVKSPSDTTIYTPHYGEKCFLTIMN